MDYLSRLNEPQRRSVELTEGPVRVIAGAGTGKTGALVARFCYIAGMLGVSPSSILCVTFTNKAAGEMKSRIKRILGDFDLSFICTFHSFCVRLLKEDIHTIGYPSRFMIADEEDVNTLLLKVYEDLGITLRDMPLKKATAYIEKRKEAPENYMPMILEPDNGILRARAKASADVMEKIFIMYLCEQKKNFACDFDDIINFAAYILLNKPAILSKWQDRMQYVMIDEFQDVSPRQYQIARLLAGRNRNIYIVGDPDQTIYTWRGADVRMLLDFDKVYPDATTIVFDSNYRSTQLILRPCNALIERNATRYPKRLQAVREGGLMPRLKHAKTEKAEAAWIVRQIKALIRDDMPPGDIAVIYRAHFVSRVIEDALMAAEIPYRIYSGTAFYHRKEVKDVICYLRMLISADDIAFERTVNNPSRGIGRKRMSFLRAAAEAAGTSMYDTLKANIDNPVFGGTGARAYIEAIEQCRALVDRMPMGDVMQHILDMSGYEQTLRDLSEWERLDNLAELKRAIEELGHDDDENIHTFLARAAIATGAHADDTGDYVRLMTVHSAKGMEFPAVFVCGMSEGIFPSKRSATPDQMEEERRLAYVAFTRAMDRLFVSDSEGRNHDNTFKTLSRFVYDAGTVNFIAEDPVPEQTFTAPVKDDKSSGASFSEGDRVVHPIFGAGMVMEADTRARTYTIQFESLATARTLMFSAPLTPYESPQ